MSPHEQLKHYAIDQGHMHTQGGVYPCLRPPYVQLKHYAIDQGHMPTQDVV